MLRARPRPLLFGVALTFGLTSCAGGGGGSDQPTAEAAADTSAPLGPREIEGPPGYVPTAGFELWEGSEPGEVPDHRSDRLCEETATFDDPDAEKHDLTCAFEGANFATEAAEATDEPMVMTWNMERNYELQAQIEAFETGLVPLPDILLVSEVDRGCDRSDGVNGAWEFAEALELNYVFGVEFVEGVRDGLATPCEHGQAIFSRHPIGNVELFRHVNTGTDRWDNPDEPRIGTRADLEADVLVGERRVRVVSVHYDDQPGEPEESARNGQAAATAERGLRHEIPTVIGGDMNTALYFLDPTPTAARSVAARTFWEQGWHDTHAGLEGRITVPFELGSIVVPAIVDLLWVRDPASVVATGACEVEVCEALSDHLPVWITWRLPAEVEPPG